MLKLIFQVKIYWWLFFFLLLLLSAPVFIIKRCPIDMDFYTGRREGGKTQFTSMKVVNWLVAGKKEKKIVYSFQQGISNFPSCDRFSSQQKPSSNRAIEMKTSHKLDATELISRAGLCWSIVLYYYVREILPGCVPSLDQSGCVLGIFIYL